MAKYCEFCGNQISYGAKFCSECGGSVQNYNNTNELSSTGNIGRDINFAGRDVIKIEPTSELRECKHCSGKGVISFTKCKVCDGHGLTIIPFGTCTNCGGDPSKFTDLIAKGFKALLLFGKVPDSVEDRWEEVGPAGVSEEYAKKIVGTRKYAGQGLGWVFKDEKCPFCNGTGTVRV